MVGSQGPGRRLADSSSLLATRVGDVAEDDLGEGSATSLNTSCTLLRLLWMDEELDVLRSVLRQETSRMLFH